jgi:hypothetical protein
MRAAVVVAFVEALLLVALTLAQFESARGASDPATDPLVSDLGRFAVVLWLGASLLIGVLVGRARGRGLQAAGLAFAAVASAIVASPLLEALVASGWSLPGSGQGPRGVYFFVPPGGSASNSSYLPLLIPLALVIGGGLAALEASVAAGLTRRVSGRA